jgi:hypothetical protein
VHMFWIQKQVSHSPPSIAIFTLPLPSALAILIRTHIFPRQFLVLETQKLEPSRTIITTASDAMARATLTLFVDRHPHCRYHRPCHPSPLRCYNHPPHALVVCRRPLSWSCGRLVDTLSPATARLRRSRRRFIVMIIRRFQTQGIHQRGGQGGHIGELISDFTVTRFDILTPILTAP